MSEAQTPPPIIQDHPPQDGGQWDRQCARCGSSAEYVQCDQCEDGYDGHDGHDCGEDCCCCLYPEDNVICDICRGHGGWYCCVSGSEWCKANPLPGREEIERGEIEWFVVEQRKEQE